MKLKLTTVVLAISTLLGSCSNDDIPLPSLNESHVYSGKNLKLYYCGELMPAKEITFNPVENGKFDQGSFLCKGITDLNQLSSIGMSGIGEGPGILPGSRMLSLPVDFVKKDDKYVFAGSGDTDFLSEYEYQGYLQGDSCIMHITKAELQTNSIAGTVWQPTPISRDGLSYTTFPFHLVWEIDPSSELDIDLTGILYLAFSAPIIPVYHDTAYSSIAQLFTNSVQTVAFNGNGNIVVRYYSSVGGATYLTTSIGNSLQYVVAQDNLALIYPNPTSLFGLWLVAQSDPGDNPDISFSPTKTEESKEEIETLLLPLLKELIPVILDQCSEGVPMQFQQTADSLEIYLNTPTLLTIMGEILKAIESHPEIIQKILGATVSTEEMQELMVSMEQLLPQLKEILMNTTKFEIGFNFNKI